MNFGSGARGGGGGATINAGPDLEEVETEQFSFQAASGEDQLRLLPSSWPADSFPQTTASLLSVASSKGLVAAAAPDALVVATTESLRQTIVNGTADTNKVKAFTPQATISVPRVSQVMFSSDENCLVIAAEQGGGLAVYETSALLNGGKEPAFQLGTEGQSVRQLLPNPNSSPDLSRFFGIVTDSGKLLLADLQERKLVNSSSGSAIFHENVSCACWSRLGKQIIAGLADGTAVQIDQQGVVKATIPEPPQLRDLKDPGAEACPVTSIYWLETFDFLIIHTPINSPDSMGQDDSFYHLAHKDKATQSWTFSKFMDPCPPFGLERKPAHHFVQRLRDWPPSLTDTLMLASTASTDVGVFTRSRQALNADHPVVDAYTYTQPPDQRRAAMQMGVEGDTSPIGMAIDLSPKEKISKPIPNDETLDKSPVVLPALYVLSNEGTLSIWWVVYNNSIRQQKPYPDLIAAGGPRPLSDKAANPAAAPSSSTAPAASSPFGGMGGGTTTATAPKPAFGQTTFGQSSFGQASPIGTSSPSTFGKPGASAFGAASALGGNQSPFGRPTAPSAFGGGGTQPPQSPFGQARPPSSAGSAFGQAGGMGQSKSPWGSAQTSAESPSAAAGSGNVFGGNAAKASPFINAGLTGDNASPQSPFAGFAKKDNQPSAFASKPHLPAAPSGSTVSFNTGSSFGSGTSMFGGPSSFGTSTPTPAFSSFGKPSDAQGTEDATHDSASAKPAAADNKSPFGLGSGGFKLGSTFQGDGSAKDDLPKPKDPGAGFFGGAFGNALGDAGKQPTTIKKEPGTEDEPKLKDIPEARSRSATPKPPPKESRPDDAPLPPDPTTWKPKEGALPPPVPPGFDFGKPKEADAPLPPDFLTSKQPADASLPPGFSIGESEKPLAGSPPIDLGDEKFSEGIGSGEDGPPEDDDEEGFSEEESGEDDEEDDLGDDEPTESGEISDPKGLAAFQSRITPASPRPAPKSPESPENNKESTTPATEKKSSYTPAGLPKAPVMFPPPAKNLQESPRSPSPVRSATSPQRLMAQPFGASRSKAPPSPAAGMSRQSSQSTSRPPSRPQGPPPRISVPPAELASQGQQRPKATPQPTEPDAGELEDEEAARIQELLSTPIEPLRDVPAFLAHQSYVSSAASDQTPRAGIGGQIERVFRDVNSMVDTLALNARGMQGFVQGNGHGEGRDRDDLENVEGWGLREATDLQEIMHALDDDLKDEQLRDVPGTIQNLREEEGETNRLRTRVGEVRKQIAARSDPDQLRDQLLSPLPMETAAQQSEVRQGVQKVQSLLAKAEEQLSLLRAELASHQQQNGGTGSSGAMPTVEAVTNTILKMTAMIEKRSGDVDVLEASIKRLGGIAPAQLTDGYEDELAGAMKASRLSQGSPTPGSVARRPVMRSSRLGASRGTPGSARKSLMVVDDEEVEAYRARKEARQRVCDVLRDEVLGGRTPKVSRIRD